MSISRFVLLSALMLMSSRSIAEQPIFGEMPRWAGGWGVQTRHEARRDGETDSQWLHVDGVYTWERWIRVTAKVPFRIDESMGIGTPTLALPLKRYFNLDGRSGSWTLAPQWFVPIANPNSNARPERFKLSAGYETEAYKTTWQDQLGSFDEWTDCMPCTCTWAPGSTYTAHLPRVTSRSKGERGCAVMAATALGSVRPSTGGLTTRGTLKSCTNTPC